MLKAVKLLMILTMLGSIDNSTEMVSKNIKTTKGNNES